MKRIVLKAEENYQQIFSVLKCDDFQFNAKKLRFYGYLSSLILSIPNNLSQTNNLTTLGSIVN